MIDSAVDNFQNMTYRLQLKEFQIALLELKEASIDPDSIHIPGHLRRSGWAPVYVESERKRKKRKKEWLMRRIEYLRRQHYIELVKEKEERLYRLTAKGKYEILRLQFVFQMRAAQEKPWDRNFYLVVFDIPESMKKYRDFFRVLLKNNGFRMLQRSVWMARYNPRPAIDELLKYLELEKYFELMKISCVDCSGRLQRKIR